MINYENGRARPTYFTIKDKDFLEGYPYDRYVYCGEVSCGQGIDRDLLEQVEGAIIGCLDKNKGARYLCNDKKRDDYKKPYRIKKITNKCIPVRLRELLPESFVPEKE